MSIFQCSACGAAENTACTGGYWAMDLVEKHPEAASSYREILGLKPNEPFGKYCSVCDPTWFTPDGRKYGVGPRPQGYFENVGETKHKGVWHGKFRRRFFPKGKFHTNGDGNLAHVDTFETDIEKYELPSEDLSVHHTPHREGRLPRPSELKGKKKKCR